MQSSFNKYDKVFIVIVSFLAILVMGYFLKKEFLNRVAASNPSVLMQTESGIISGTIGLRNDTNASGGRYIEFGATGTQPTQPPATPGPTTPPVGGSPVVVAAGDVICDPLNCHQMAVSDVAVAQNPTAALILGDLCHTPSANCFNNYYHPSWGRLKEKSYPVTGNHEYLVGGAVYYFDYWNGVGANNGRAGERGKGYYSFNLGQWHVVALNSQCSEVGGCNPSSAQYRWLEQDLNANQRQCTLAIWHIPVFSSGGRANNNMKDIFGLLYSKNAEIVLNGHDHIYERFAPQNSSGVADSSRGIREFIVGTAGANHTTIVANAANSEVKNADTFGVLSLTLNPTNYLWNFVPAEGRSFTDSGSSNCH